MDEVEVGAVGDAVEQRMLACPFDLVPADMRKRGGVFEADRATGKEPEGLSAVLIAPLEQELEAEADAKERPARGEPGADRSSQATAIESSHGRLGCPDARHDEGVCPAERFRVARD